MKQSKEVKGTVLCENFNEKFVDLIRKLEYPPELEKYLKYFENEDVTSLSVNLFNSDDFGKFALCDFEVFTSGYDSYYYHITFNFNDYVRITIFNRIENLNVVFKEELGLNGFKWDYLFILPNTDEENASEPEQPADDAEYEEDCFSIECSKRTNGKVELTLGTGKNAVTKYYSSYDEMYEDNPEYRELFFEVLSVDACLTPLERTVFEEIENCYERYNEYSELFKVAEYGAEYNGESAEEIVRYGHLANEQIFNSDYLKELISKAGLDETYQSWLRERKKQEAVTVL